MFGDDTKQLSESELLKKISENYGNVISIDYREGAGTAYLSLIHISPILANVHHRAFKRDGVQSIQIE